jgi:hypothetical protein
VSFSLDDPEDHLAAQLKGIDVLIICCLIDEAILANAAKKAGVKRYVPCFYATVMPRGIQTLRDTVSGATEMFCFKIRGLTYRLGL